MAATIMAAACGCESDQSQPRANELPIAYVLSVVTGATRSRDVLLKEHLASVETKEAVVSIARGQRDRGEHEKELDQHARLANDAHSVAIPST
jgi:hypothetical protein